MRHHYSYALNEADAISIHAPLTGCDGAFLGNVIGNVQFQSTHPLRDATKNEYTNQEKQPEFQSTHPLRDATVKDFNPKYKTIISIHAPLTGCDTVTHSYLPPIINFNPRTPYGMRR